MCAVVKMLNEETNNYRCFQNSSWGR